MWQANLRVSKTPEFFPFTLSYFLLPNHPPPIRWITRIFGAHHPCVCALTMAYRRESASLSDPHTHTETTYILFLLISTLGALAPHRSNRIRGKAHLNRGPHGFKSLQIDNKLGSPFLAEQRKKKKKDAEREVHDRVTIKGFFIQLDLPHLLLYPPPPECRTTSTFISFVCFFL